MKKFNSFLQIVIIGIFAILTINLNAQQSSNIKSLWQNKIKSQKAFVENKGQYADINEKKILYANFDNSEKYYFTNKGIVIKLDTILYKKPLAQKIKEIFSDKEEDEKGNYKSKSYFLFAEWQNSNPDVQIEVSEKTEGYFTFGLNKEICNGYKKITYKNIYPNIDIEYTLPNDSSGIKYNLILRPGADISDVALKYSGDVKQLQFDNNGNIVIKTPLNNIIEHAPKSYYSKTIGDVASSYIIKDNLITFFVSNTNKNETLIIDPWTSGITGYTDPWGYDVDYDNNNNLYVYYNDIVSGSNAGLYVRKFSPTGVLLWTHVTTSQIMYEGNFLVDKIANKIYISEGFNGSGAIAYRLNSNGIADGFVSQQNGSFREMWDMTYNINLNKIIAVGGGTNSNLNGGTINPITGNVVFDNFTGFAPTDQDIACQAIDANGNLFVVYAYAAGYCDHYISLINSTFNGNVWQVLHGMYGFRECSNHPPIYSCSGPSSNAFNGLAVNNNFLYYYDGAGLAAYNKTNGTQIAATSVSWSGNFYTPLVQGGITVDDCDTLWIGGDSCLLSYYFDGTNFNQIAHIPLGWTGSSQKVFDVKYDRISKLLFVSGHNNVGVYSAQNSCSVQYCQIDSMKITNEMCIQNNELSISGNLYINTPPNQSTLVITEVSSGITQTFQAPFSNPINFTFNNVPFSTQNNYIIASFTGSVACSSVLYYNVPELLTLSTSMVNPSCGNSDGAGIVNIISNGTPNYSYVWSNGQSTTNTLNQTNIMSNVTAGNYTVTVTNGNGCTTTASISLSDNGAPNAVIQTNYLPLCNGLCNGSATVIQNSTNSPFSYNWSNGQSHVGDSLLYDTTYNLCAGIVSVTVTDNNGCAAALSYNLAQPNVLTSNVQSINPSCAGFTDGHATATPNGGTPSYTYIWNTLPSQYTQTATSISAGSYTVTVFDANGCSTTNTTTLTNPLPPQASYTYTSNGLIVNFTNTSTSGTYNWDFGNGFNSTLINPSFTYSTSGTYNVCLTINSPCGSDTSCQNITVTLVNVNNVISENIEIFPNPATDNLNIVFSETPKEKVNVELFDNIGQKVAEYKFTNKVNEIDLKQFAEGMYYIKVEAKNGNILMKIVINKN